MKTFTLQQQEKAKERFEALPWPSKTDEEWRRTDPGIFSISSVAPQPTNPGFEVGWEPLAPSLIQQGVILTDLATAQRQFPDLVEEYLLRAGEPEGLRKFVAQHEAFFAQGIFCYVPDGVTVALPLKAWVKATVAAATRQEGLVVPLPIAAATRQEGLVVPLPIAAATIFPHTLVVVGKGANLTLIEQKQSEANGNGTEKGGHRDVSENVPIFSNAMVEVLLKEEAKLHLIHLQRWGSSVYELFSQRAILERESQFLDVAVGLGSTITKANVETALTGTGCRCDLLGILFGSGNQHFDFHTLQDHQTPHTTSDLLYKSVLKDSSKAIYTGLIRIRKEAQKSDAYQANRNLLLSQGAKADSIPMLEIEADDVRCTHGVAVGPVDPEQSFYLMSRGLSQEEAQQLIVEGFFDQVFQRIPLEDLRTELIQEVAKRLATVAHSDGGKG